MFYFDLFATACMLVSCGPHIINTAYVYVLRIITLIQYYIGFHVGSVLVKHRLLITFTPLTRYCAKMLTGTAFKGVARKKLRGGPNLVTFKSDVIYL